MQAGGARTDGRPSSSSRRWGHREIHEQFLPTVANLDDGSLAEPRARGITNPHDVPARYQRLLRRTTQLGKQIGTCVGGGFEDAWHVEHLPAAALDTSPQRTDANDDRAAQFATALDAVFELDLEVVRDRFECGGKSPGVALAQRGFERLDFSSEIVAVVFG